MLDKFNFFLLYDLSFLFFGTYLRGMRVYVYINDYSRFIYNGLKSKEFKGFLIWKWKNKLCCIRIMEFY